jgi:hypothetical protein
VELDVLQVNSLLAVVAALRLKQHLRQRQRERHKSTAAGRK